MSGFTFRPGVRENVSLIIIISGGTGSGKTFTAMRLASGIAQGKPFAMIDTEAGRAKHYADQFTFDHGDLAPPFTPARYAEAIAAADAAGYPVIVVDSFTHEWSGEGGVLDMQEAEYERLGSREATKLLSWAKPKGEHKSMVAKLLQVRAHLILCLRAEEKIEMVREDGKTKIVPKQSLAGKDGWIPICEKSLPFEATVSFLLLASAPGVPQPIKIQQQHRALFPTNEPITEETGRKIHEWAKGAKAAEGAPKEGGAGHEGVGQRTPDPHRPDGAPPTADEALLVKAREWAECGTQDYAAWWKALAPEQRVAIGKERHESFKMIAAAVAA